MKQKSIFLFFVFLAATFVANSQIKLISKGASNSLIIIPANPNSVEEEAAKDLVYYIKKSSDFDLPVFKEGSLPKIEKNRTKIYIGKTKFAQAKGFSANNLKDEEFKVVTGANYIIVLGKDLSYKKQENVHGEEDINQSVVYRSPATIWGVNYLLDHYLGVRWLWPGKLGTYIPEKESIIIPSNLNISQQPLAEQRELPMRWPKRKEILQYPGITIENYRFLISKQEQSKLVGESLNWGERHQLGSRTFFNTTHAFTDWWEKYGKDHPEYFAETPDGSPQPFNKRPDNVKLRIGNPSVGKQIIKEWKDAGSPDLWRVGPNDGIGYDISAESRAMDFPANQNIDSIWNGKGELTARYLTFWNGLLNEMKRINPDVRLVTYVYSCYRNPPPAGMKVTPGIVAGFVHSYDAYEPWKKWNDAGMDLILRPNWWHQGVDAPHIPLKRSGEYFKFAQQNGMRGFRFDQLYGYWSTQGTNYYLIARLNARPDLSVDEVLNEYYSAFGAASGKIKEYISYWEDLTNKSGYPHLAGGALSQGDEFYYDQLQKKYGFTYHPLKGSWFIMPYLYTDKVIDKGYDLLNEASLLAASDKFEVKKRIEFLRDGLKSLQATREMVVIGTAYRNNPNEENKKKFFDYLEILRSLRRENTLNHVSHGDVQFTSEIRRGIPTSEIMKNVDDESLRGL